jgi:ribosomal protein S18 acetylase RimI-like enzyme
LENIVPKGFRMIIETINLTSDQIIEANNLINICEKYDNAQMCIQIDHSLNLIKELKGWVLYYNSEELIGMVSIFAPMAKEAEISICVKPDHRKKGIAKELLNGTYKILNDYNIENILYVCDRNAQNGINIIKTKNLNINHTEYTMKYINQNQKITNQKLMIKAINETDLEELIYVFQDIFDSTTEESKSFIKSSIMANDRRGYAGIIDNEIIGIAFVGFNENISINTVGIIKKERNKGYGKELIKLIINKIRKDKCDIIIDVDSTNVIAYKLYKEIGFREILTIDYYEDRLPKNKNGVYCI